MAARRSVLKPVLSKVREVIGSGTASGSGGNSVRKSSNSPRPSVPLMTAQVLPQSASASASAAGSATTSPLGGSPSLGLLTLPQTAVESLKDTTRKNRVRSISLSLRDFVRPAALIPPEAAAETADDIKLPPMSSDTSGVAAGRAPPVPSPRPLSTTTSGTPRAGDGTRRFSEYVGSSGTLNGSDSKGSSPVDDHLGGDGSRGPSPAPVALGSPRRPFSIDELSLTTESREKLTYVRGGAGQRPIGRAGQREIKGRSKEDQRKIKGRSDEGLRGSQWLSSLATGVAG